MQWREVTAAEVPVEAGMEAEVEAAVLGAGSAGVHNTVLEGFLADQGARIVLDPPLYLVRVGFSRAVAAFHQIEWKERKIINCISIVSTFSLVNRIAVSSIRQAARTEASTSLPQMAGFQFFSERRVQDILGC